VSWPSTVPDDPFEIEWSAQAAHLRRNADIDADWNTRVAAAITRDTDRLVVDIGCGGGGMAKALAAGLPDGADVVAIDNDPDVLAQARENLAGAARCELGSLDHGLEKVVGAPADLVWSAHAVHHAGDQQACVGMLAGLLAPGGRLALAEGGLPTRHLPWDTGVGEPGLEIRLDAANDRWFTRMRAQLPGSVRMPYGWSEAMRRAGLVGIGSRTLLTETPTPLGVPDRERVAARLAHWVDRLRPTGFITAADLATWDALLDPDGEHWIGHREDLMDLSARTIHTAHAPA
jgi:SAM-dependent methyltransferase